MGPHTFLFLKNPTQRGKALQLWERMCYRWKTNSSFFSTYKLLIFNLHSPGRICLLFCDKVFHLWVLSGGMTLIDPLEIRLHTLLLETIDNHFIVVTLH